MTRRAAAGAAAVLLLALVLASQTWAELPRRVRFLAAYAPKELAVRRLGGSGTAIDRRYFSFLENARRLTPVSAKGIIIRGTRGSDPLLYLAHYHFAPLPVSDDYVRLFGEPSVPHGWVVATYGVRPVPQGAIALPEGAIWGPAP